MKSRTLLSAITVAGLIASAPVFAQTSPDQPVTQAQLDALNRRIEQLEKLLEEKRAPAATQVSIPTQADVESTQAQVAAVSQRVDKLEKPTAIKVGTLSIKPYGYIKLDAAYDSQKPSPTSGDFTLFAQPKVNGKNDSQTDLSARDSRFGVDLSIPEENGILVTAKVEADFFTNGVETAYSVRLRHAWADAAFGDGWSVRAGQDWDAFFYIAPTTVDAGFLGDAGFLYSRRAQLKLTKVVEISATTKLTAKIALARTASGDLDGLGQDDGIDSAKPTVEGLLALDTQILSSKPTKFSIGGQIGTETVDSAAAQDVKDYDSNLIVAGILFPLTDKFAVQGNAWTGKNLDGWLGGIGQGVNTALKTSIAAKGGWVQAVFNPTDKWNVNLGYGFDNPDDADLSNGGRTENKRIFTSVFYRLTKAVTLATEYSVIATDYKGAKDATDNRIQFTTKYQF
jgi:hypothetical protein